MTRTRMITIGSVAAVTVAFAAAGVAGASTPGHHSNPGHGPVGDDIYSSHHSRDYGRDYGVLAGLIWDATHLL